MDANIDGGRSRLGTRNSIRMFGIPKRWSGIPGRNDDGNAMGDWHKQSMNCGALRVIIIDDFQQIEKMPQNAF